jgi:ERCC4-type nuclease
MDYAMITGLFIDTREPEWVQRLTFEGIPTLVTYLEHGDAMCATDDGQMLLIERKTPDDFLGSLRDQRLLPQLTEMLDKTRWAYLMITGEFQRGPNGHAITERGNTGWDWNAIQGALLTIQEMGIFIIHSAGDTDYEQCILRLGKRDRKPDLLLVPPKMPKILSVQESIIASLPGIGVERLKAVMDYCGTPAWALVALTDLDTEIPGVGRGVKTKVRNALKLSDGEQLAVSMDNGENEVLVLAPLGAQ